MSATTKNLSPHSAFSFLTPEANEGGVLQKDLSFSLGRLDDAERQVQSLMESLTRGREALATSGVVNALQGRHEREVAEIKKAVAKGIVRAEESEAVVRERIEAEHSQAFTNLQVRHEKEIALMQKAAAAEVARLQELLQAQKNLGASAKELAEINQAKAMNTLQTRHEREMASYRETVAEEALGLQERWETKQARAMSIVQGRHEKEMALLQGRLEKETEAVRARAAMKINELSEELSSNFRALELLRRENSALSAAHDASVIREIAHREAQGPAGN